MPVSAAERRFVLNNLTRLAEADIQQMWRAAELQTDVEFAAYVTQAFPEIVDPYQQLAAQTGATFFEEDFPEITQPPLLMPPLPPEQLATSAQWALGADGVEAISRMAGTAQRAIYDGERNTTAINASRNGMRWVRVARPNACAFCRMLASRTAMDNTYRAGAVFDEESGEYKLKVVGRSVSLSLGDRRQVQAGYMTREEALQRRDEMQQVYQINSRFGKKGEARTKRLRGSRNYGDDYHDECRCTAKAIPVGVEPMDYLSSTEPQFADLAAQWNNEYIKAANAAESGDPKKILAEWRTFGDDIA
jgi:hypothetical protein